MDPKGVMAELTGRKGHHAAQLQGRGTAGFHCIGDGESTAGGMQPAAVGQCAAEAAQGGSIPRVQVRTVFKGSQCFQQTALVTQCGTEKAVGFRQLRRQGDQRLAFRHRCGKVAVINQCRDQVQPRLGPVGVAADAIAILLDGFAEAELSVQGGAEAEPGPCVLRLELQGRTQGLLGGIMLAEVQPGIAQIKQDDRLPRVLIVESTQQCFRFGMPPHLRQRDGRAQPEGPVTGGETFCAAKAGMRLVMLSTGCMGLCKVT